jgi:hypothetical protein
MLKKILLTCSLTGLAIGFFNIGESSQWGVGLPLGAVFLFLTFIVTVLEKEFALYDAEQREHPVNARRNVVIKPVKSPAAGGVLKSA